MGIGGQASDATWSSEAELLMAYTGQTRFSQTTWNRCWRDEWVLDYLNRGQQRQMVEDGRPFQRRSGVAALYEPALFTANTGGKV